MARTKRSRRSYSAGEWGRNRVRVFPDPKTGILQIEWRENGRRLTRSLKHRDWSRAKRQADEAAAGFAGPEVNGRKDAEPEPLTLETLFDIYGEEVTPTKGETGRMHDRAATAMFLDFLGRERRPETLSRRDWDRFIRERRAGRVGPSGEPVGNQTIGGDLTFLMAVLNWAARSKDEPRPPAPRQEPAQGSQEAPGEEPGSGRRYGKGMPGASEGVSPSRLAVPRRPRARARNGTPHRSHPQAQVGRYRPRRRNHPVAQRAREDGIRAPDPVVRPGARRSQAGVEEELRNRGRAGAALGEASLEMRGPVAAARLVVQSRATRGDGAEARKGLALPEAQVCQRPDGPAAQGALRTRWLEERQDGPAMLPEAGRGTASEGSGSPPRGARLNLIWRESNSGNSTTKSRKIK